MTRRPLILQLYKTEPGQEDYAQFLHTGSRKFTDFCESLFLVVLIVPFKLHLTWLGTGKFIT